MGTDAHEGGAAGALRDLERFLADATSDRETLGVLEIGAETRGRELLRRMLQEHLDTRGTGDVGPAILVDTEDGPARFARGHRHRRSLVTVFGTVTVTRASYAAPGYMSVHPIDAELCLPARSFSYELSRRVVRTVVRGPFAETISVITEHTGVRLPMRSVEAILKDAAVDVEGFYDRRAATPARARHGEIVVGAIDCKGIPMVKPTPASKARRGKGDKIHKKKMATVAAVHTQAPQLRSADDVVESLFGTGPRPTRPRQSRNHKRVWASLIATKDAFIGDVAAEMARRDPRRTHPWVILTDGERALQRRVIATFTGATLILDLIHVLDKLWKAAHVLHPEGSPEAEAFVRERTLRILNGGVGQVVKGLRQMSTKRALSGNRAKTIADVTHYLYANRTRMRYDTYLANGWPIASGSVEGACKNLVRDRFERSGMRWSIATAEALLKLRAVYLSDDLDDYWDHHIQLDQQRNHPSWTPVE